MHKKHVRDYMTRELVTLREDDELRKAVELVMVRRIRHIPVVSDEGRLVGILADRDIKRILPSPLTNPAAAEFEEVLDSTPLGRVMTREPVTVDSGVTVEEAVTTLVKSKVGGLPVVEDGVLVGMFTKRDALRGYLELLRATSDD
jgi:acetoin utilization protein AcuB